MRFEHIVLLIIAFNVVTAVLQRRARKKARARAEAAQSGRAEERAQPVEVPPERRRGSPEAEEGMWEDAPRSRPVAERPGHETAHERMPSLGKDILDQIARDLGLKLPKPAPRPLPAEAPEPEWRERGRERERRQERPATRVPQPVARPAAVPAARKAPAKPIAVAPPLARPRVNLGSVEKLREAFILKEILDAPVSRRPGR